MTYDTLKEDLKELVTQAYVSGTSLHDIRAALHYADLNVEMWAALETSACSNHLVKQAMVELDKLKQFVKEFSECDTHDGMQFLYKQAEELLK